MSWQQDRLDKANNLASSNTLSFLIEYHDWLKARIKENSLKHRQDLMVAVKAIEIKVSGFSSENLWRS